jgi:predicted acyl esterase
VVGPISLTIYAAIDKEDTNWIVILKDVGPDVSVQTAREGERSPRADLHERELTRGWLKASYRAVDEKRSRPGAPFHKLVQSSIQSVKPGEVYEYQIQILATANLFKAGHRICLDITSMDVPTGTGAMTNRGGEPSAFAASSFFLDAGATNLELTKVRSTQAHSGL